MEPAACYLKPEDRLYIYEVCPYAGHIEPELGPAYLGLWLEEQSAYFFFRQAEEKRLADFLKSSGQAITGRHELTYRQWQGGQVFAPLLLPGLSIAGPETRPEFCAEPCLRLWPGLVFGNGLHPTTRHCLELLLALSQEAPLGRIWDLGCGSGILGLAALKLGAEFAALVDYNPLCVQTARTNAALNGFVPQTFHISLNDAGLFPQEPGQLLLANLHWPVLERVMANAHWARHVILSGLMRSQKNLLYDLLINKGFKIRQSLDADQTWFSLWAERN